MKSFTSRFSALVIAALLAFVATRNAQAVDVFWNVPLGDWDVDANWNPAVQPAAGDDVHVENGGIAQITTDESANGLHQILVHGNSTIELNGGILTHDAGAGAHDVKIGNAGGGTGTLTVNAGTANLVTSTDGWAFVGVDGGTGFLNMNGGTINMAGERFIVGNGGGSTGTGTQVGGIINAREFRVGTDGGTGTYTFSGGEIHTTQETFIGQGFGSIGDFTNSGTLKLGDTADDHMSVGRDGGVGTFSNNASLQVGNGPGSGNQELRIGAWGGTGTFTNFLGNVNVANELRVGLGFNGNGQGVGTFENFGDVQSRHISIGRDGGKGVFNQNTGTVSTNNEVWVGAGRGDDPLQGADGTLNVHDGTINSNGDFMIGFGGDNNVLPLGSHVRGVVNQDGGTVNSTGWMNIGRDGVTNKGTYNISGGTLNVTGTVTDVGRGAQGEFNHTANANPLIASNVNNVEFWVGMDPGANGVATTPGTNLALNTLFTTQRLGVGRNGGTGVMNQGDGGEINVGNDIHIGRDFNSKGTYNLGVFATLKNNGGGETNVGRDGGTGILNMSPGSTFHSGGENFVGQGNGANGTVNNDGGTYDVTGNGWFNLGRDRGVGKFNNMNGGTVVIAQELRVGMWGGTGTFNNAATAGNVSAANEIRIGMGDNVNGRGNGTFNLLGGNLTGASNLSVGRDGGIGLFNQDNENGVGVVSATELLVGIGGGDSQQSGGSGVYNLKSGTINVTAGGDAARGRFAVGTDTYGFTTSGAGTFNMTGGTLNMTGGGRTSIGWNGVADVNQSSGTMNLNDIWIGSHDGGLATGKGSYNMSGDAVLNTPSLLMLGRGGTGGGEGTFTIKDSASATIGGQLGVSAEPGAKGTYTQTGGVVGFGGNLGGNDESMNVGNGGARGGFGVSTGTVTISAGTLQQTAGGAWGGNGGWNFIGHNGGTGNFNLSGTGVVELRGRIHIGAGGNSTGTVTQTGGTFTQLGSAGNGNEHEITLGDGDATGNYNISGGSLHTEGSMYVGHWTNSHGTMNITEPNPLNPTTVSVDRFFTVARYADPGQGANLTTGVVVQSGGTVNAGEFALASGRQTDGSVQGTNSIKGEYTLSGGALNVAGLSYIGRHGEGHFTQSGGTYTAGSSIRLGSDAGAFGTYSISAGTLSALAGAIEVGEGSTILSTFTQTGGSVTAFAVAMGTGDGSKGDYSISGGTLTTTGPAEGSGIGVAYADNSTGNLTQTGGAIDGQGIAIGTGVNSVGKVTQSAGSVHTSGLTPTVDFPIPANTGVVIGVNSGAQGSYSLSGTGVLNLDGRNVLLNPFGIAGSANFTMTGGRLQGVGLMNAVQGNVPFALLNTDGTVAPASTGSQTGTMTVVGSYDDTAAAKLEIQLGGTAAGAFDVLHVAQAAGPVGGAASLTGTVALSLVGGFQPHTGDFFQVVTADGGLTNFSTLTGTNLDALALGYRLNRITDGNNLGVLAALPGDADLNSVTDFSDLGTLLNNFNTAVPAGVGEWSLGDFNDDHFKDFSDLGILLNNFNKTVVPFSTGISPLSSSAGAVPEPSSWALLALGGLALGARRMRRRS